MSRATLVRRTTELVAVRGPQAGCALILTGTAFEVWNTLDFEHPRDSREIAEDLERRFLASPGVIANDTEALLAQLAEAGAIIDVSG